MNRWSPLLLTVTLACGMTANATAHPTSESPDCFAADTAAMVDVQAPLLVLRTDALVHATIKDSNASPMTVYNLSRQMILIERIHRRSLTRSESQCATALDRIRGDFSILKRTFIAYTRGDAELAIEKSSSESAQQLLQEINAEVEALGTVVDKLQVVVPAK